MSQDAKALVAHQCELERLYSKNQLIPRIRSEFTQCEAFNFSEYFKAKEIPEAFGFDVLTQMALHKRCQLPTLVGALNRHFDDPQRTADMLMKCAEADLMDWSAGLNLFVVKFTISDDVQAELDRFQFPLPMVVPPKLVKNNRDIGYITTKGSLILKNNHHDGDICLDHINRCNKTKLTINFKVAELVKNQWRNLDKAKSGETKEEFLKRKKAFEKYDRTARDVMSTLMEHSQEFYLTHKYDKRGRTYCQGYHVSYQGAPWNKAVISFANKEIIE